LTTTPSVSKAAASHLLGASEERHGVGHRPAALRRVFPGHDNALAAQVVAFVRRHEHGTTGAHHHVGRVRRMRLGGPVPGPDDDQIGGVGGPR
jgi:hypothetical protein